MIETVIVDEYELQHDNGLCLKCFRNGVEWRDLAGDGMVLALFQKIVDLEEYITALEDKLEDSGCDIAEIMGDYD